MKIVSRFTFFGFGTKPDGVDKIDKVENVLIKSLLPLTEILTDQEDVDVIENVLAFQCPPIYDMTTEPKAAFMETVLHAHKENPIFNFLYNFPEVILPLYKAQPAQRNHLEVINSLIGSLLKMSEVLHKCNNVYNASLIY